MEIYEISLTTLDNQTEVLADLKDGEILFLVRSVATAERQYTSAVDVIRELKNRGYAYGEELIRLAVYALEESCYAA